MYCLFMYRQRGFAHEKTIITNTIEEMMMEINTQECCTIDCCKEYILIALTNLTDETINHPYHWQDKYHGFCLFRHKLQDGLKDKIYNRYSKDPRYNDCVDFDCSDST